MSILPSCSVSKPFRERGSYSRSRCGSRRTQWQASSTSPWPLLTCKTSRTPFCSLSGLWIPVHNTCQNATQLFQLTKTLRAKWTRKTESSSGTCAIFIIAKWSAIAQKRLRSHQLEFQWHSGKQRKWPPLFQAVQSFVSIPPESKTSWEQSSSFKLVADLEQ